MQILPTLLLAATLLIGELWIYAVAPLNGSYSLPAVQAQAATRSTGKNSRRKSLSPASILVMVNDDPITLYDINSRAAFLSLNANIGKDANARFKRMIRSKQTIAVFKKMQRDVVLNNQGLPRSELIKIFRAKQKRYAKKLQKRAIDGARNSKIPRMRAKALKELIEEHLKLQGAKRVNVTIPDADIDKVIASIAKRNKKTPAQFAANLRRLGTHISTLKSRLKANFAWRRMISRRFGRLVSINDAQIDDVLSSSEAAKGGDSVKLKLKRITLGVPKSSGQGLIAKRYAEAEQMARRFRGCKSMSRLAKGIKAASYKDLGLRSVGEFAEPAKTMLLSTSDGKITAPILTNDGIVFYAVCGRRAVAGNEKQRAAAKGRLRQTEFEILAKRHMRDLRAEAHVCRRHATPYTRTIAPCF